MKVARLTAMRPLPTSAARYGYGIDTQSGLALARIVGPLDGREMLAILTAVHGDPRWRSHFDVIWDCSLVVSHAVAPSEVPPIVEEAVEGETGRAMMVEAGRLIDAAISQLIAAFCRRRGKDVHVVRTVAEALAALGYSALPERLEGVDPLAE